MLRLSEALRGSGILQKNQSMLPAGTFVFPATTAPFTMNRFFHPLARNVSLRAAGLMVPPFSVWLNLIRDWRLHCGRLDQAFTCCRFRLVFHPAKKNIPVSRIKH